MIFSWFKNRRRKALLAHPFPTEWLSYLETNVGHYRFLCDEEQAEIRDMLRVFIAEKNWEGCGGLVITDEIRVTIAAQACILILGLDHDCLSAVTTILVYPQGFIVPTTVRKGFLVTETDVPMLGQAFLRGPVILAWDDVLRSGRDPSDGENLVYHEFAHQLDFIDGIIDGTPPLSSPEEYQAWRVGMGQAYEQLLRDTQAGQYTLLGSYAAKNAGEFFAVATERFFDKPDELEYYHPTLYGLLRAYYHQDPGRRQREWREKIHLKAKDTD
jgi:Mlc titration factor MtfA (ptsG expression regulator)